MFEDFSERSLLVVFLTRKGAGRRGAESLEPVDLLDAVVREDQGEMAAKFPRAMTRSGPLQPPERPFFSQEKASQILSAIEHVLPPKADPLSDYVDMACSPALTGRSLRRGRPRMGVGGFFIAEKISPWLLPDMYHGDGCV